MSDRFIVGLLAVCVAGGIGGGLLATGVLTSPPGPQVDAVGDAVRGAHVVDGEDVPSPTPERQPTTPPAPRADDAGDVSPPDPAPPKLAPRPDRVRPLTWAETARTLASPETWAAADDAHRENVARRVGSRLSGFSYQRFETYEGAGRKHHLAVFQHDRSGLEMVLLPGGRLAMGSRDDEPGRGPDETLHEVTLSPFLISRTEVTQSAWLTVYRYPELMPSHWRGPDLPIESISRDAAAKFCERAGGRLPTEAEWEFACRAGGEGRFWFGDDDADLPEHGWVRTNAGGRTHPVGMLIPNPYGLFDMHGNVWEWVSDRYGAYAKEQVTDPQGAEHGSTTIRGGSWMDVPSDTRSAKRLAWSNPQHNVGFRLAKSVGD